MLVYIKLGEEATALEVWQ